MQSVEISVGKYANLVPQSSESSYQKLRQSIKDEGFDAQFPIIVNQDGTLLDGHHRYRACQELRIEPVVGVKTFTDPLLEKKFVIERNLKRRHLNDFQKAELGYLLEPIEKELADRRMKAGTLSSIEDRGRTVKKIAETSDVSRGTYERAKIIIEKAPEDVKDKVRRGKLSINKACNEIKKEKRLEELEQQVPVIKIPDGLDVRNGDFRKLLNDIEPDSIDLIFTDPPYGNEYIPLYEDLAKTAGRLLKDGGSIVTYLGQGHTPTIIKWMEENGLKYWWTLCVEHTGGTTRIHDKGIQVKWKPLLWFVKGGHREILDDIADKIISKQPDKAFHEWAQSTVEADYVIERLTTKNAIILDPFMGSGTTGIAALNLKRQFIGCEFDQKRFEDAQKLITRANSSV